MLQSDSYFAEQRLGFHLDISKNRTNKLGIPKHMGEKEKTTVEYDSLEKDRKAVHNRI